MGLKTPRNMEVYRGTPSDIFKRLILEGVRVEVSARPSVFLASFAFQACSFNHSDISPCL